MDFYALQCKSNVLYRDNGFQIFCFGVWYDVCIVPSASAFIHRTPPHSLVYTQWHCITLLNVNHFTYSGLELLNVFAWKSTVHASNNYGISKACSEYLIVCWLNKSTLTTYRSVKRAWLRGLNISQLMGNFYQCKGEPHPPKLLNITHSLLCIIMTISTSADE